MGWRFDDDSWRNVLAIGEGEAVNDFALEIDYTAVEAAGFFHVTVKFDHSFESPGGNGPSVLSDDLANFFPQRLYVFGRSREGVETMRSY